MIITIKKHSIENLIVIRYAEKIIKYDKKKTDLINDVLIVDIWKNETRFNSEDLEFLIIKEFN